MYRIGVWVSILTLQAQGTLYLAYLEEKPDSFLLHPERFLTSQALERRKLQGIPVNLTDAPIPAEKLKALEQFVKVRGYSRWLNAALIEVSSPDRIPSSPFIRCIEPLSHAPHSSRALATVASTRSANPSQKTLSPVNIHQLHQLNLHTLHELGYTGKNIRIAILDAGFPYMDEIPAFRAVFHSGRFLGGYDFVAGDSSIFGDNSHGTQVASVIIAHDPDTIGYVGGAPDVAVLLARTENALSESRIEEWNWARAAEWADSMGAYIIQSSLGYSTFDDPAENYTYADMNGRTAITTQAARIATQKGLLVITSAGNEGNSPWRYITAPADADSIIAVGAINSSGQIAPFSSRGPTADHRIKPDLVALGWGTYIVGLSGTVQQASGTSFAAPLITSLAACIWQSAPELPGWYVREALLQSGDRARNPDTLYGYGIPDGEKALLYLRQLRGQTSPTSTLRLSPNPVSHTLTLALNDPNFGWYDMEIYDTEGRLIWRRLYRGMTEINISVQDWRPGLYIVELVSQDGKQSFRGKFVKL